MAIQSWKDEPSISDQIFKGITDKKSGLKPAPSTGCQICERHLVQEGSTCPACGKHNGATSQWTALGFCKKALSVLASPFLFVHYSLSNFFHQTAKRIARPGFEQRVEFILGFTFGLGVATLVIALGFYLIYSGHLSYFLFPSEPLDASMTIPPVDTTP